MVPMQHFDAQASGDANKKRAQEGEAGGCLKWVRSPTDDGCTLVRSGMSPDIRPAPFLPVACGKPKGATSPSVVAQTLRGSRSTDFQDELYVQADYPAHAPA